MKKTLKNLLALLLTLCLSISLFACNNDGGNDDTDKDGGSSETKEPKTAAALVTVDINPSVEITVDENGTVVSVYGANEDGQILLYGESENLVGKKYDAAIEYVTDLAVELGYLNEQTGVVNVSAISDNEELANEIGNSISSKIQSVATENGITVSVDMTDPFSLLCELKELKEKYPENERIQAIGAADYKIAMTLSEREGISIVAAVEYDNAEAIERISKAHETLETYATEAYALAKSQAVKIYNNAMGVMMDGVYHEIYMDNLLSHVNTYYYGAVYQAYKTTARSYRSIYEIKAFADSVANYEVSEATVAEIAEKLGLEDTSVLENEEGKVTVESLIAFTDEFIGNHEISEEIRAHVSDIIADAKVAAELADKGTNAAYKADMQALKLQIGAIISAVRAGYLQASMLMTEEAKADFEACLADLSSAEETIAGIIDGGITESEVEVLAAEAEAKAEAMLERIKADLSEEELALAESKIEKIKEAQAKVTAEFEERLSAAEEEAKKYIEEKREERKNAHSGN